MQILKQLDPSKLRQSDKGLTYNGREFAINTGIVHAPYGYDPNLGLMFRPSEVIETLNQWMVDYGMHPIITDGTVRGKLVSNVGVFNETGEKTAFTDLPFYGVLLFTVSQYGYVVIQQIKVKRTVSMPEGFSVHSRANLPESDGQRDEHEPGDEDHGDCEDSRCE